LGDTVRLGEVAYRLAWCDLCWVWLACLDWLVICVQPIYDLAFVGGTLCTASYDRSIKIWIAQDRSMGASAGDLYTELPRGALSATGVPLTW